MVLANNTGLVGRLPDEAAGLAHLHRVGLRGTNMSCVPAELAEAHAAERAKGREPPPYRCAGENVLPCFLEFAGYTIPLSDNSKMSCRPIRKLSPDRIITVCPPAALYLLPDPSLEVLAAQWDLSPSYYQYQGCVCLEGHKAVWSRDGTVMRCEYTRTLSASMWVLVGLGAAIALLALSLLLLSRRLLLFRSRWLREAELKRKRRLGVPKDGANVSIVITDIEAYSGEWLCPISENESRPATSGSFAVGPRLLESAKRWLSCMIVMLAKSGQFVGLGWGLGMLSLWLSQAWSLTHRLHVS
jgi:hypothetical protein